jgi:hypothetical protein
MEKNSEEAIELFEMLSENSQKFSSRRKQGLKGKGVYKVSINGGVQTQMATMERKLEMLVTSYNISPVQQIAQIEVYAICSHFDHTTETCPMSSFID